MKKKLPVSWVNVLVSSAVLHYRAGIFSFSDHP